ncbi:kinesin-related protein [Cryptosporidium ubiquitum]|uniref:Kinesin-related protein n=1 Tax=Cryptosporidium ubiquitum TaxID=857276 RepID=A0A1J4MGC3_9CRYT|nr:kinesin-related protein [Cryptosporidium ubiquitum]OII73063.1 kinesin-related protein [Cryptosporidium ubiquitum]
MVTPLERRLNKKYQKAQEIKLNGNISDASKAFGIPPRFSESLIMNTHEGKRLLISVNSPNDKLNIKRDINRGKNKFNFRNELLEKIDHSDNLSDINSYSAEDNKPIIKEGNNPISKLNVIDHDSSSEFESIFRSVSNDLEQLSMQMSDSLNVKNSSVINLTSPNIDSGANNKGYAGQYLNSNINSANRLNTSKESFQDSDESISYSKSIDSLIKPSNSQYNSFSSQKSNGKYDYSDNHYENSSIINELIRKLTLSISKLKKMVMGKDNFVAILREQMQKSNFEIIKLSQKVDFLQKELTNAKKSKEKYKDSMKKLLNDIQDGRVDGTIHNYIMEIEAMKIQNERNISNLNNSEIALIQLQTEKNKLLTEKTELTDKIIQLEEKIHKLNLVVNQVTDEKLHLLETKESANKEIEKLLENIKSCNDENKISLEELKRGYELNNVLQDHVMLLKAQLEISTEEKTSQEKVVKDLKDEVETIRQNMKSLEHRESILLSALEDSSYRMTDIDKALEEQKLEYENIIKKENDKYIEILHTCKKQTEEIDTLKQKLEEKISAEKEQIKANEELKRKFGSFESHIRRLLDARDNEIIQLNDYMDGKLRKKDEEINLKIQEICKIQQEREKRLINQMLDQHDGFERKRIEYEHEIDLIRNNFTEKLDKAVKLENEKQLRLAETLVNKEHELMIKENIIQEIDKKNMFIEQQLNDLKACLDDLSKEKNATVEKLLSLEQWGTLIQTMNHMNPELQNSLNTRLNELRNKVERLEKQEDTLNDVINHHSSIKGENENEIIANSDKSLN